MKRSCEGRWGLFEISAWHCGESVQGNQLCSQNVSQGKKKKKKKNERVWKRENKEQCLS